MRPVRALASVFSLAAIGACSLFVDTGDLSGGGDAGSAPANDSGTSGVDASPGPRDGEPAGEDAPYVSPDAPGPAFRDEILKDKPAAYWRMGITTGTTVPDETGNGNTLTLRGTGHVLGAGGAVASDPDKAIVFNGQTTWATAKDARALDFAGSAFSLECWAKRDPIDTGEVYQHLIGNSTGTGPSREGYLLYVVPKANPPDENAGTVLLWSPAGDHRSSIGKLTAPGAFVHHVAVYDGASLRLFIDGVNDETTAVSGVLPSRTNAFLVGQDNDGSYRFAGAIDEIAVYGRALTPTEILRHRDLARGVK
jgi:concanavalin A-like lectin/glucanase superfamily protein